MDTKRSPQTPDYKVINALMGAVKHPGSREVFGNLRKEGMLAMALEVLQIESGGYEQRRTKERHRGDRSGLFFLKKGNSGSFGEL